MASVTCSVYEGDGSTLVGDLTLASGIDATWGERSNDSGSLSLPYGSTQAGWLLADAPRIVRVFLDVGAGPVGVFDWIVERYQRDLDDESGGTFRFSGSGLRAGLAAGQVRPYAPDCLPTQQVQARNLGFADPSFDTTGLPNVVSYGVHGQQASIDEFDDTPRAPGFPDKSAAFIWSELGPPTPEGRVIMFSPTFTVAEDGRYIMSIQVDDDYITYLVGEEIGRNSGFYRWRDGFDTYVVDLCTGVNYRWVIDGKNPLNPNPSGNVAWALGTIGPAGPDGKPQAQNHIVEVTHDATGGSYSFRPIVAPNPVTIDYNESAASVQADLDAELGPNRVEVTSITDGLRFEFVGFLANITVPVEIDTTALTGYSFFQEATVQDGESSSAVMATSVNWTAVAYPTDPVGLNAYELASLVIGEAQARGDSPLDPITYGGTIDATQDSRGVAWGFDLELTVSPYTTSVASILTLIEQQGYDVWFEPGWVLHIADDKATGRTPNAVDLTAVAAGEGTSWKGERVVVNVGTTDSDDGIVERDSASSITKHGRWEEHLSTPRGSGGSAGSWLSSYVADLDEHYTEGTVEWSADEPGAPDVLDDVQWADTVTAEYPDGTTGDARVVAVGLSVDDDNDAVVYRAIVVPQP